MRRTAALIVGGGPAGSSAAICLARGGLYPCLIERSQGPRDIVCGGFLGWDALAALRRLGINPQALGARPIDKLRLISSENIVEVRLPKPAAGLSRRTLDEALLRSASDAGADVVRGRSVRSADLKRLTVQLDDGGEIGAESLFLATGKHELRGAARRAAGGDSGAVGLRTSIAASDRLVGVIELHLFQRGYAGLLLQEDGRANLCLSAARARLKAAGGVEALLASIAAEAPRLREWLQEAPLGSWDAVAGVPYGWRAAASGPGLFRLGDQAAVIASLAGDGVAIALTSGTAAAAALLQEGAGSAPGYQRRFARRALAPLKLAEGLRWAAEHERPRRRLMRLLRGWPGLVALAARLTRIG